MPELPEVETVRRTLADAILGRPLGPMQLHRPDVLRDPDRLGPALADRRVVELQRLGKQLALCFEHGPVLCVHLGMSGQLRLTPPPPPQPPHRDIPDRLPTESAVARGPRPPREGSPDASPDASPTPDPGHVHASWPLVDGGQLRFRDPRRFGGLWLFSSPQQLRSRRWDRLGPDALTITPKRLHAGLSRTRRELKAALLDQSLVAGLGNIYVDELLFAVGLHPQRPAATLDPADCRRLVAAMRRLLARAIDTGGSTLRDYVDATGQAGGFQHRFRAYGRHGQPCRRCGQPLDRLTIAGRTTTACPHCQRREGFR